MSPIEFNTIKRIAPIAAAVLALILLLMYMQGSFVSKVEPGNRPLAKAAAPSDSESAKVEKKRVDDKLAWTGTVKSRTVANIAPKLTARILEINVDAGDRVKKGDTIARLDERELKAQENAVLAVLAGANAQAVRAKADEHRIRELFDKEAATRENFDSVVAASKAAQASVNQAASQVGEIRSHLADAVLLAPFNGTVVKRLQQPGDMGMPGVPLAVLQVAEGLRLEAEVPGTCAGHFSVGMNATLHIDTLQQTVVGQIDEISPELDPQTRSQLIKVALPDIEGLQPGMFGRLEQACGQHEALLVPSVAVKRIGQLEVVKVWHEGRLTMRHIRTGKSFGEQIEVISGLHEGEIIATGTEQAQ